MLWDLNRGRGAQDQKKALESSIFSTIGECTRAKTPKRGTLKKRETMISLGKGNLTSAFASSHMKDEVGALGLDSE